MEAVVGSCYNEGGVGNIDVFLQEDRNMIWLNPKSQG